MARLIVENAAVAGKSLPPPTDVSWGVPPIVWNGYPNPVDADEKSGVTPSGTSHAIPYPSNMAVGELVIVLMGIAPNVAWTIPAAITVIGPATWGRSGWRRWDGTEGATFTVTSSAARIMYHVYRVQDAHPTTPPEAGGTSGAVAAGPTVLGSTPLNPAGWGTEKTLWIAAIVENNGAVVTAYPAGYPFGHGQQFAPGFTQARAYALAEQATNPGGFWAGFPSAQAARRVIAVRPRPA